MKILYCDKFIGNNSNESWYKAFSKFGNTIKVNFEYSQGFNTFLEYNLDSFNHLHFGGSSCKFVPSEIIQFLKNQYPQLKITFFMGDARKEESKEIKGISKCYSYIDKLFITNKSQLKGVKTYFTLCPYDSEQIKYESIKITNKNLKDVVFIGNATPEREIFINYLKQNQIQIDIYGEGWKEKYFSSISYKDYSKTLSKYKIVLGYTDTSHIGLEG